MKYLILAFAIGLSGCAATTQPQVGQDAKYDDSTLNDNNVDFLSLIRVTTNNYYGVSR